MWRQPTLLISDPAPEGQSRANPLFVADFEKGLARPGAIQTAFSRLSEIRYRQRRCGGRPSEAGHPEEFGLGVAVIS